MSQYLGTVFRKVLYYTFVLLSAISTQDALAEFQCDDVPIVSPKSVNCADKSLTYCEYRNIRCTGIKPNFLEEVAMANMGYTWSDVTLAEGVCPPVNNTCPSATKCLSPDNEVPIDVRQALQKMVDPKTDFSSFGKEEGIAR